MELRITVAILGVVTFAACSENRFDQDVASSGATAGEGFIDDAISQTEINFAQNSSEFFAEMVGNTVYFDVDQSTISNQNAEVLRQQAEWLTQNPDFIATVEGHADERGTREYNLALGNRRAAAVKAYLVDLGVPGERLITVTYGKERPVSVCSSELCWSQNRRSVSLVERADSS